MLAMKEICLCLLLVYCCTASVSATNPGLKIRLSQAGLHNALQYAVDELVRKVDGMTFGETSSSYFRMWDGRIGSVTRGTWNVNVNHPGMQLSLDGFGLSATAQWRAQYKKGWFKISTSGRLEASASGVYLRLGVTVGIDANGRPTLNPTTCSAGVNNLRLRTHGGISWILNPFMGFAERYVKGKVDDIVCDKIKSAITEKSGWLSNLKMSIPVKNFGRLDYSLISTTFNGSYMETAHKGQFLYRDDSGATPFQPAPMPDDVPLQHITLYISDYVPNSFFFAMHRHGVFNKTHDTKSLSAAGGLLHALILGSDKVAATVIEKLDQNYAGSTFRLQAWTLEAPVMDINGNRISIHVNGRADISAILPSGEKHNLLQTELSVNVTVSAFMDGNRIKYNIVDISPHITVLGNNIPESVPETLNKIMDTAATEFLVPQLNAMAAEGFEIPNSEFMTYQNPHIHLRQDTLVAACDVVFH